MEQLTVTISGEGKEEVKINSEAMIGVSIDDFGAYSKCGVMVYGKLSERGTVTAICALLEGLNQHFSPGLVSAALVEFTVRKMVQELENEKAD